MNRFVFHGHPLVLHPDSAVFLEKTGDLVVSDVHLGKAATFRARGIPVPEGDAERDLTRLVNLAAETGARRLIVAGDLFHAPGGITPEIESAVAGFLTNLRIPLMLVGGNHDDKLRSLPAGLSSVPSFESGGVRFVHDPADAEGPEFHIAGHLHPVVRIKDGKRTSLRLPCFLLRGNLLVLPSFGSFTGGAKVDPQPGDRAFVTLRDRVVEVPLTRS